MPGVRLAFKKCIEPRALPASLHLGEPCGSTPQPLASSDLVKTEVRAAAPVRALGLGSKCCSGSAEAQHTVGGRAHNALQLP